jgi:hypothetical protein
MTKRSTGWRVTQRTQIKTHLGIANVEKGLHRKGLLESACVNYCTINKRASITGVTSKPWTGVGTLDIAVQLNRIRISLGISRSVSFSLAGIGVNSFMDICTPVSLRGKSYAARPFFLW